MVRDMRREREISTDINNNKMQPHGQIIMRTESALKSIEDEENIQRQYRVVLNGEGNNDAEG